VSVDVNPPFGDGRPLEDPAHEPRSTGEIISDALSVLRRSFPVIFSVAVPFCAADLLLREVGQSLMLGLGTVLQDPAAVTVETLLGLLPKAVATVGFMAASFGMQQLLSGAVTTVGEQAFAGRPASAKDALLRVAQRGGLLVVTSLVFMVAVLMAFGVAFGVPTGIGIAAAIATDTTPLMLLGFIPGVIMGLAVLLVLTLRWSLYAPVVICEGRWGLAALRRSSALTAPRGLPFTETPRFRLSVLFLIALAVSAVLQSLFVVPRLVVAVLTGWSFSDGAFPGLAQLPLWFAVPFGLIEVVTNAAVIPLSGLMLALFMFDLRVRYEPAAEASSVRDGA
jgi:hypothetical protein